MKGMISVVMAGLLAAAFSGCTETEVQDNVGIVEQPGDALRVGDNAPNFDYVDSEGKQVTFSNIEGDVSIVAFVRSDNPALCPIAGSVLMLADKYSNLDTKVKFICISEPVGGKCDLKTNVIAKCGMKSMRVVGLCDAGGMVRDLFRVKEPGTYVLIDDDGKIAAIGRLDDLRGMEKALRKVVSEHEENLPPPYDE